jgi:FAD/FMN-containing dehydrogenase
MKIHGWGRYPIIEADSGYFETRSQAIKLLDANGDCIAFGMGKSYGDSALNPRIIKTQRFNKLLTFDADQGIVCCECGVTLSELIEIFLPKGWFLKVTPGTKLITVGGAIASDVHGKNHHSTGCFSESVKSLRLLLPDGSVETCSEKKNPELFRATCGGMGLTGLILDATIQLQQVNSAYIRERIIRCDNLAEAFEQFEAYRDSTYSVAWIDCLARGEALGRCILMAGEHDDDGDLVSPPVPRSNIPIELPSFLLNKYSVALFNQLYYLIHPSRPNLQRTTINAFFYPLDRIENWNRMYGTRGFTQYQLVLPKAASLKGIELILKRVSASEIGSFLAVLKLFGPQNENYLSFPMEGYTLTFDFKIQAKLFPLLNELDKIVTEHDGRLYLTKDVRMPYETFAAGYPRLNQFTDIRTRYGAHKKFNSLQSKRLGI